MVVREARAEIVAHASRPGRRPMGCLGVLGGLVALGLWPGLRDALPGGDFVSPFVGLGGILLAGAGLYALLLGGRKAPAARAAVEAALRQLSAPGPTSAGLAEPRDRETDLRAATLLVSHAWVSDGPVPVRTVDPSEVDARVGARLPLVIAVDRLLGEELAGARLFGAEPEEG
jgi:hypothetical protein